MTAAELRNYIYSELVNELFNNLFDGSLVEKIPNYGHEALGGQENAKKWTEISVWMCARNGQIAFDGSRS